MRESTTAGGRYTTTSTTKAAVGTSGSSSLIPSSQQNGTSGAGEQPLLWTALREGEPASGEIGGEKCEGVSDPQQ